MRARDVWIDAPANSLQAAPSLIPGSDPAEDESPANKAASKENGVSISKFKGNRRHASASTHDDGLLPRQIPEKKRKTVHFTPDEDDEDDVQVSSTPPSASPVKLLLVEPTSDTDKENKMAVEKPKLKLRMSSISAPVGVLPESATRTPSIKLKLSQDPASIDVPQTGTPGTIVPASASKKRKKQSVSISETPVHHPLPNPLLRKITFKNAAASPQTPITPSTLKIRAKGKIPKRALAVGYDSELDEREVDPVILEGFILRMQPGPDCDHVRSAIENGTMGLHRSLGGAGVNIRFLDTQGRRGVLIVRSNQYAVTMVDLPCIIEGMKSWDKRGFIKSLDISQMLLVLGPCKTDAEAKAYPLPPDVNPHNHQYAHGITAPMKWVRKRRFARTKKVRLDDIEAIDRRVAAMLEADAHSLAAVKVELLDHDPRQDEEDYSGTEAEEDEEDDEEDADADADAEPDDYFQPRNAGSGQVAETPSFIETPAEEIDEDQVNEFERMFAEQDEEEEAAQNGTTSHLAPETAGESSFAVTSTSASPSADTGTPAMNVDTPASGQGTTDDDDEMSDEDEEREKDDDEKDDDENVVQVKERIQDLEDRIEEQMGTLKKTTNVILRKKIAKKIGDLKGDVGVLKRSIGMEVEEDGDGDDDGEGV